MKIVGQKRLLDTIDKAIENNTLPRFIMLVGDKNSGKKTIAKYIADKLSAKLYKPEGRANAEYVRGIIEESYKQTDKIVYLIPDINFLSKSAVNSLLKVTEEPPNNAYFITTVIESRGAISTLRSRCTEYKMDTYIDTELLEIAKEHNPDIEIDLESLFLYRTPGDIINYVKSESDNKKLEEFATKVIDNIGTVSGANVFKIDNSIAFKEDDEGFNLSVFWVVFNNICMKKTQEITNSKRNMYLSFIRVTGDYRQKLTILGINKRNLFDLWLLEIRDVYSRYN